MLKSASLGLCPLRVMRVIGLSRSVEGRREARPYLKAHVAATYDLATFNPQSLYRPIGAIVTTALECECVCEWVCYCKALWAFK